MNFNRKQEKGYKCRHSTGPEEGMSEAVACSISGTRSPKTLLAIFQAPKTTGKERNNKDGIFQSPARNKVGCKTGKRRLPLMRLVERFAWFRFVPRCPELFLSSIPTRIIQIPAAAKSRIRFSPNHFAPFKAKCPARDIVCILQRENPTRGERNEQIWRNSIGFAVCWLGFRNPNYGKHQSHDCNKPSCGFRNHCYDSHYHRSRRCYRSAQPPNR